MGVDGIPPPSFTGILDPMPIHESTFDFLQSPASLPGIQHVHSLEAFRDSTLQLCGISAEFDPWLLRHCKYDERGLRLLERLQIRNVGGVPIQGIIPVHFTVVENALYEPSKEGTLLEEQHSPSHRRQDLEALVTHEQGLRLISL